MRIKILKPNKKEPLALLTKQVLNNTARWLKITTVREVFIMHSSSELHVCFYAKKGCGFSIYHALRFGEAMEKVGLSPSTYDLGEPCGDRSYASITIDFINKAFADLLPAELKEPTE